MKLGLSAVAAFWRATRDFFTTTIWRQRLDELPAARAFAYRVARILHSTWKGFREHRLTSRAAALTYYTVLSLVPFLAFAFAVLKGFGVYTHFVEGTVRPYLRGTFGANPPLLRAVHKVLDFVEDTDVGRLGTLGVLLLVYGAVSLLANVESALNAMWGSRGRRPLLRQVTDYTTLIVTTPLLMLLATTLATAAQSSALLTHLRSIWALGPVIDFLLSLTSLVVTIVAMVALYAILPNVKIRPSSAVLGGVVSGLLWQAALLLHVSTQAGVARYNALYSGFVALPVFLVWTYLSWTVVLVGALVAASHQNERRTRQRFRAEAVDQRLRELLAVALTARITRAFRDGAPRPSAASEAEQLEVSPVLVQDILDALCRSGVLVTAVTAGQVGYVPGRDLDELRLSDVLAGLRYHPDADDQRQTVTRTLDRPLLAMLEKMEEDGRKPAEQLTLRQLADLVTLRPEGGPGEASAPAAAQPAVHDGKQPDLPS